jgi:23S rRNA (adenine2030-N6)-methyltransferase
MNYRHAFHAGNFADVLKHAVLCRILLYLRQKSAPFRVIDTHAGAGGYDLGSDEARRGGEWRSGIGRLREAALDQDLRELLAPYLDAVAAFNPAGALTAYPGSPLLARAFLRPQDRLLACEIEPAAAAALASALRGDARAKALRIDGWAALSAYVPPKERRGLVLVDPPFEQPDEFARLADGFCSAHRKWPSGIYLIWYPIKNRRDIGAFERNIRRSGRAKILRAELTLAQPRAEGPLVAAGLIVANPPWTLPGELARMLAGVHGALAEHAAGGHRGGYRLDWLGGEN